MHGKVNTVISALHVEQKSMATKSLDLNVLKWSFESVNQFFWNFAQNYITNKHLNTVFSVSCLQQL